MTKAKIKNLIDINCMKAINIMNSNDDVFMQRHADMVYTALDYLRDILVNKGVGQFKKVLKDFDVIDFLRDKVIRPCTYYEEEKLKRCFNNFKTYVLK